MAAFTCRSSFAFQVSEPRVSEKLVSLIDVVPTSLAFAGIEVPASLEGHNIVDESFVGRASVFAARDRCGDAHDRIRCVRTREWKYIVNINPVGMSKPPSYAQMSGYKKLQYPVLTLMAVMHEQGRLSGAQAEWFSASRPREELYDLVNDPDELHNLADDPRYSQRLQAMRTRFNEWNNGRVDLAGVAEGDDAFIEEKMAAKRAYYARVMKKRGLDPGISDREYLQWWKGELGITKVE